MRCPRHHHRRWQAGPLAALLGLSSALAFGCARDSGGQEPVYPVVPAMAEAETIPLQLGLMWPILPGGQPPSVAEVQLGARLFVDPRLSADGTVSCKTCHQPEYGFADPRPVSLGVYGRAGHRNSQTLLNAVFFESFGWTGEHASLEEQALSALQNPKEMALGDSLPREVVEDYGERLIGLYGRSDLAAAAAAVGAYQRTLIAGASRFDRWVYGGENVLTDAEKRGFVHFLGRARCVQCHFMRSEASHPFGGSTGLYTDGRFHNIGLGFDSAGRTTDPGRFEVTNEASDYGAFKTPSLRNVALTAPYMHDGSLRTLEEVVEHYDKGGAPNANLDPDVQRLNLTPEEKSDLVAFMNALTSESPPTSY